MSAKSSRSRKRSSRGASGTPSADAASPPEGGEARPSRYQRYEVREVHRSAILNAPYNPRRIKEANRERLRENLKRVGLTHPLTWNERTGHLVSGHQRLGVLDSLEGTKDYTLRVAVVDLDDAAEKAQVVFENNSDAQGEWDMDVMRSLIEGGLDLDAAALDVGEVAEVFGTEVLGGQTAEKLEELVAEIKEAQARHDAIAAAAAESSTNEADFYRVVVFRDKKAAEWLASYVGDAGEVFLSGDKLRAKVEGQA